MDFGQLVNSIPEQGQQVSGQQNAVGGSSWQTDLGKVMATQQISQL